MKNYVILCKYPGKPTKKHPGIGVHNFPTKDKKLLKFHIESMEKEGWETMALTQRQAEAMLENLGRKVEFAQKNLS